MEVADPSTGPHERLLNQTTIDMGKREVRASDVSMILHSGGEGAGNSGNGIAMGENDTLGIPRGTGGVVYGNDVLGSGRVIRTVQRLSKPLDFLHGINLHARSLSKRREDIAFRMSFLVIRIQRVDRNDDLQRGQRRL